MRTSIHASLAVLGLAVVACFWGTTAVAASQSATGASEQGRPQDGRASAATSTEDRVETLQTVARFDNDFKLVGIAVSYDGRVFASAPASGGANAAADARGLAAASVVEVDPKTGRMSPYPDAAWNRYRPRAAVKGQWVAVQALWVDRNNRLWALDKGGTFDGVKRAPRLMCFDLAHDRLERTYTFGPNVLEPADSLNDVRIDDRHNVAYISNAKNDGGILVVDLDSGTARMVLRHDRSSVADPKQNLMFGDRVARTTDGQVLDLDTDGIALSPDRDWLYYRPLSDRHYYRIPTAALIDRSLSSSQRSAQVQYLGDDVLSGGLAMSDAGVLYAGDLEHHAVMALTPYVNSDGQTRLHSRTVVHDPDRLAWADGFAIANGFLYISDSHLNETAFANGYPRRGAFTIFRVPLVSSADTAGSRP